MTRPRPPGTMGGPPRPAALLPLSLLLCMRGGLAWDPLAASLAPGRGTRLLLGESDHKYEMHDPIKLYANKVGPFSNPRCGQAAIGDPDVSEFFKNVQASFSET